MNDIFNSLYRKTIGFDDINRVMDSLYLPGKTDIAFPPYNIRKVSDNNYVIEIALAGYNRDLIEIETQENRLVVTSKGMKEVVDDFIHRGVTGKAFERSFILQENVLAKSAEMVDGMLRIFLEKIIPEHAKKQRLEIKAVAPPTAKSAPQLLNEDSSF